MKMRGLIALLPAVALVIPAVAAETNPKLPSHITTLDGKSYYGVAAQPEAVYPDGIVVRYQPRADGQPVADAVGTAKIEFRNLPENVRNLYPHDAKRAEEFEAQQAQANSEWLKTQAAEESSIMRYRAFAELNRSLAGDADVSYSVALDSNGKVTAQGYNRTTPAQIIKSVNVPSYTYFPVRHGLVTDYVPVQTSPGTVILTK